MKQHYSIALGVATLVVSLSVKAHDPSEHTQPAEKPNCAAITATDASKPDLNDPVVQAMLKKCTASTRATSTQATDDDHHKTDHHAQQHETSNARWYNEAQVKRGNEIYQANCASCHKPDASGTTNWRQRDANGKYPPPPLNGTAHTWHHPLKILRRVVNKGGIPLGGMMPSFEGQLNAQEIDDVLAWVQSHWSDEIYALWSERDAESSKPR